MHRTSLRIALARSASPLLALAVLALATGCTGLPSLLDRAQASDEAPDAPPPTEPVPTEPLVLADGEEGDWVELVSGEWLRGDLQRLRANVLEFSSEELDDQSLEVEKVRRLRTRNEVVVLTEDDRVFRGRLVVENEDVWVVGERTVQLRRDDVLSVLSVDGDSDVTWTGDFTLGATVTSGNTRQNDYGAHIELKRESTRTEWTSTYDGAVSSTGGSETANNHRATTRNNVYFSRRAFAVLPGVELYRDRFQNLDARVTAFVALGYEVVDLAKHQWSLSAGPAALYRRLDSPAADQEREDTQAGVTFQSKYEWEITPDVDFDFDYSLTAPLPDTEEYYHNLALRLTVDLMSDLDLDVAFVWDRVNEPRPTGSGDTPKKDDFRTTIGLGWSF